MALRDQAHRLLRVLDDAVARDGAFPGVQGRLAFGVESTDGSTVWWEVSCAKQAAGQFLTDPSSHCDALLLMGTVDADAILRDGKVPDQPTLLQAKGDRELLSQFVKRYLAVHNLVSIRAGRT